MYGITEYLRNLHMHDDSENTSVCSAVFEGEGGWPNSYNSRDDERGLTLKENAQSTDWAFRANSYNSRDDERGLTLKENAQSTDWAFRA